MECRCLFILITIVALTESQKWDGVVGRETTCKMPQRATLEAIYSTTDGRNWRHGWDTSSQSDPCMHKWYGVQCDDYGNIIKLVLPQNRMKGPVPDRFDLLVKLEVLDLSFNQLQQNLPKSIATIRTLKHINVQSNYFNGLVPEDLGNMDNLSLLDISLNNFEGDVPDSIIARRDSRKMRLYEQKYGGEKSGNSLHDTKYGSHKPIADSGDNNGYTHPAVENKIWGP